MPGLQAAPPPAGSLPGPAPLRPRAPAAPSRRAETTPAPPNPPPAQGASPNLEDKTPRGASPLHYAAEAYAADPEGDPRFEEVLRALVGAGAVGIFDRKNALPDPGDDADYQVAALVQQAEKAGEAERAAQRDRRRRANTDLINAKQKEYQDGCSAAMVAVMEAGSHEGYKGAMHLGPG